MTYHRTIILDDDSQRLAVIAVDDHEADHWVEACRLRAAEWLTAHHAVSRTAHASDGDYRVWVAS